MLCCDITLLAHKQFIFIIYFIKNYELKNQTKNRSLNFPEKVSMENYLLMLDQSFLHRFDGKYRREALPFVFLVFRATFSFFFRIISSYLYLEVDTSDFSPTLRNVANSEISSCCIFLRA